MATSRLIYRSVWRPTTSSTPIQTLRTGPRLATRSRTNPWQSSSRSYAQFRYQRFQQSTGLLQRWAQSPYFYHQIGVIGLAGGGFYVYNLEEVPVSGRRRFNIVSPESERASGEMLYRQVMEEYGGKILPPSHPQHRLVESVLNRLIPYSGPDAQSNAWEVHVIKDPQKNAFVIPGGKVFVFSGILDVCRGEDGLAAVLGHEIAHNVAHHAAERMSSANVLLQLVMLASMFLGLGDLGDFVGSTAVDLGFLRPGSRKQESEADYIGLLMMAEACFDPNAAMGLWGRMEQEDKATGSGAPPHFLSTHPSNHNRLEKIREWLPQAEMKRESSACQGVSGYAHEFKQTFQQYRS